LGEGEIRGEAEELDEDIDWGTEEIVEVIED